MDGKQGFAKAGARGRGPCAGQGQWSASRQSATEKAERQAEAGQAGSVSKKAKAESTSAVWLYFDKNKPIKVSPGANGDILLLKCNLGVSPIDGVEHSATFGSSKSPACTYQ